MSIFLAAAVAASSLTFTDAELSARYYSDLGPAEVDVSSYPPDQQRNYELFRLACSQCHTPARALNSPVATREGWRGYVAEMGLRGKIRGMVEIKPEELEAIVEFLAYDGRVRKLERRPEFEEQSRRLQRRFWQTVEERMRRLRQSSRKAR